MAVTGEVFKGIADAIREKDGTTDTMKINQMAERIRNLPSGGEGWDGQLKPDGEGGESYIHIYLDRAEGVSLKIYYIGQIGIDWGDGSALDVWPNRTTANYNQRSHNYSKGGYYIIKVVYVSSNAYAYYGTGGTPSSSVSSTDTLTFSEGGAMYGAQKILKVSNGPNMHNLGSWHHCANLRQIIHKGGYSAGSQYWCVSLVDVTAKITSIASYGFYNCPNLKYLDLSLCNTIPTLGGNSFGYSTQTWLEIIVPDELYDDWILETNWSAQASRIIKKSQSSKYGGPGL